MSGVAYGQRIDNAGTHPIPVSNDGLSVPVSGTLTATIDESTLATSAKQDTGNTSLATIAASAAGSKTAGQATMANSVPVAIASNQSSVPVTEASAATIATAVGKLTPPSTSVAITKSDSTDLTSTVTKGIWVGTGGDVAIKLTGDSVATTLANVPDGTFIPGAFARVMSTNTTASGFIGFGG